MYCIVLQGCSWWFEIKLNYHPAVICVVSMPPQQIRTNPQHWRPLRDQKILQHHSSWGLLTGLRNRVQIQQLQLWSSVLLRENHGLLDLAVVQNWDPCWEKRAVWEWGRIFCTGKGPLETGNLLRLSSNSSFHHSAEGSWSSWCMTRLAIWGENALCHCCVLSVSGPGWLLMLLTIF